MSDTNGVTEYRTDAQSSTPVITAETHPYLWSVRRELWESRFLYIAPLIVGIVVLLATMANQATLDGRLDRVTDLARQKRMIVQALRMSPAPAMLATFIVGMFFSLDALYGERRDRSILFWKSLPVSDRTVVLSKFSIPTIVLPSIAFAIGVTVQLILSLFTSVVLIHHDRSAAVVWSELDFFEGLPVMIYGLTVHALWFAPIYAYFLLVSAWAKRAPFLWAILPLLTISAIEKMTFDSMLFMNMLHYRINGAMKEAFGVSASGDFRIWQLRPIRFLTAPGLWVGLVFAAVCLFAAIRVRRHREPI